MTAPDRARFFVEQCKRITAFWPSFVASREALREFVRALDGYADSEIEQGISHLIDSHLEPSAPKLGHIKAAVRAVRPKRYETATEDERDLYWPAHRREEEARIVAELAPMEAWLSGSAEARQAYEAAMAELLAGCPPEGHPTLRRILHRGVLRTVCPLADRRRGLEVMR